MPLLRRLLLVLALLPAAGGSAAAKFADPLGEAGIFGAWAVLAREGEDGGFGFCAAELSYGNGLVLAVLLMADARIELYLFHPDFDLTAGQRFVKVWRQAAAPPKALSDRRSSRARRTGRTSGTRWAEQRARRLETRATRSARRPRS